MNNQSKIEEEILKKSLGDFKKANLPKPDLHCGKCGQKIFDSQDKIEMPKLAHAITQHFIEALPEKHKSEPIGEITVNIKSFELGKKVGHNSCLATIRKRWGVK